MYIFLDIDGVLNKSSQWKRMYSLDKECIKNFCQFAVKAKGDVILTSSWRSGFVGTMSEENTSQIKELENLMGEYGVTIKDKTPVLKGRKRDDEIERYLYLNSSTGEYVNYIIIDDDRNEYGKVGTRNYFTDSACGFTEKDAKRCSKMVR